MFVVVVEMMGLLEWVWCRIDGVVDVGDVGLFKQKMGTGFWQR